MKKTILFLTVLVLIGCTTTATPKKQEVQENPAKARMEKHRENECNNLLVQLETIKPHTDGYYYLSEYKDFLNTVNDCYVTGYPQVKYCDVNMSQNTCVISLNSKIEELTESNEKLKAKNPAQLEETVRYCNSYLYGPLFSYWKIEKDCLYKTQDNAYHYLAFSQATDGVLFVAKDYNNVVKGPFFVYTKEKYKSGDDIGGYLKYKGEYSYTGIDGFPKKVMAFERYNQTCTTGKKDGEIKQICSKMQKQ